MPTNSASSLRALFWHSLNSFFNSSFFPDFASRIAARRTPDSWSMGVTR